MNELEKKAAEEREAQERRLKVILWARAMKRTFKGISSHRERLHYLKKYGERDE